MTSTATLVGTNLSKSFGGVNAASSVDLELHAGRVTVLLGPNGAGKTTVFNLLSGRLTPDAGEVFFHDEDISRLSVADRALRGIGRSFQEVRLFEGMTVKDNVTTYALASPGQSLVRTLAAPWNRVTETRRASSIGREALDFVGVAALEKRLAGTLSYAEQKLVSIARLLAMGSEVLLLDEPASGVDGDGRERLIDVIRKLSGEQKAVCVIEHNLDVVKALADDVVFVAQGKVLAQGEPESIFASDQLADIYFGARRGL
jgi:branched-chain amino acid transport system permease protein